MEKFILDFGDMSFDTTLKLSDYSFASSTDNHSTNSSNNSKGNTTIYYIYFAL
jgi:hypothetical protein